MFDTILSNLELKSNYYKIKILNLKFLKNMLLLDYYLKKMNNNINGTFGNYFNYYFGESHVTVLGSY